MPTDTTTEADNAPETGQEPGSGAEAPQEPIEPTEALVEAGVGAVKAASGEIEMHSPAGALTLRPNQTSLDSNQTAALVAIGIDVKTDPGVAVHVRPFMHMCQIRGLDPFAREAYLIGRGKGDYRKWTMQTGIDGYRKIAASTGRLVRVAQTLWTGADDDDRSYRPVDDGNGGVIMRRVWYDQWPASRGNPGAAKVVVEHYDTSGNLVTTEAVADWGMYAPYNDVWAWNPQANKKQPVTDDDGKTVQELSAMWAKGGAFMLAKCAEALAYRKAFPAVLNGFYVTEEMHRLDAAERDRVKAEQTEARREAYLAATQTSTPPLPAADDTEEAEGPVPVSEVLNDVVDAVIVGEPAAAADPAALLLAELTFQAETLGHTPERIAQRQVRALRKNLDAFTATDLLPLVTGLRAMVASALDQTDAERAGQYRAAFDGQEGAVVLPWATAEPAPEDPADDEALDADPEQPHRYVDDGDGACATCGGPAGFGQDPLHPEGI